MSHSRREFIKFVVAGSVASATRSAMAAISNTLPPP